MGAFRYWVEAIGMLAWAGCISMSANAATLEAVAPARPAEYRLDPIRSGVALDIEYFAHRRITMRFGRMRAELAAIDDDLAAVRVSVTVDVASLEANVPFVAAIVEGDDMLDASRYPTIRFVSTRLVRTGASSGILIGALTIRAITHVVALDVTFDGPTRGARTLAFLADGHVSRGAFGLSKWRSAVGDDVHMRIQAKFVGERANP
jgi:polyisoprenoid-binding protein YceI